MIDKIPLDIKLRVMTKLSADDVYSVGQVCPEFKLLSENETVAKKIIRRDLENLSSLDSEFLGQIKKGLALYEYLSIKVFIYSFKEKYNLIPSSGGNIGKNASSGLVGNSSIVVIFVPSQG